LTERVVENRRTSRSWLVVLTAAVSLATTLVIWQMVRANERIQIRRMTRQAAIAMRDDLSNDLGSWIYDQVRLAKLWEVGPEPTAAAWKASAAVFIEHHPGCLAVEWLHPSYEDRWTVRSAAAGRQLISNHSVRQFLDKPATSQKPLVSPGVPLPDGTRERLITVPIHRNGELVGFVIAFFDVKESLDHALQDLASLGYSLTITEGMDESYRFGGGEQDREWAQPLELALPGVTWHIRVWPQPEVLSGMWSRMPGVALVVGLLVSLLLTLTVHFAQRAGFESQAMREANNQLITEVEERQRTEEALLASQARLSGILEMSVDAVISVDDEQRITLFSRGAEKIFGYESREVMGKSLSMLIPERLREAHVAHADHFLRSVEQNIPMSERGLIFGLRKDGNEFPIEASVTKLEQGGDRVLTAIMRDVTERVRAEEELRRAHDDLEVRVKERTQELAEANTALQAEIAERNQVEASLRELTGRLMQLQDEERRRIARELHDGTTQSLVALSMELALGREMAREGNPNLEAKLRECVDLAEQCTGEIRTVSYLLHPPLLDELGLGTTVRSYADGFSSRSGIRITLKISPDLGRLEQDVELALFRIVQESLTNIHRHSQSRTARLQLARAENEVTLEISDDGRGLPKELLKHRNGTGMTGVGIAGMRERVRQLGGQFELKSNSRGTTIRVTLPAPVRDSSTSAA
jgi:PAS domain S-box-containing protein